MVTVCSPFASTASSKQSVFPSNGNILKKKARNTILSVLSKRQSQEKLFLGERSDQNSSVSSSEPSMQQTKWPSEAMIVDLNSTKSNPQWPSSASLRSQSQRFSPPSQAWISSDSNSRVSQVKTNEQDNISSRVVETTNVAPAGLDALDGNTKIGKISSRWPPQPRYPESSDEPLGWHRASAPKHLSCPPEIESAVQGSEVMVVSMSPSYTSVKDITQDTPKSPKFESDSVKVSIPFQVQGQPQLSVKEDQRSDAWSSSVSICVPFQVNENGDGVSVLSSEPSVSLASSLAVKLPLLGPGGDERDGAVTKPRAHSSPQSSRRKPPKGILYLANLPVCFLMYTLQNVVTMSNIRDGPLEK